MSLITWGLDPWGRTVALHAAWWLLWPAVAVALIGAVAHALFARFHAEPPAGPVPADLAACVPDRVPRHTLAARLFHWVMAAAMLTLLFTAFLPKAGMRFDWLQVHWIAGVVLVLAILFHLVHSLFFQNLRSMVPTPADLTGARPGKYPIGNKLFHLALVASGLTMAVTGALLMVRVRTPFFTRDPYILSDAAWGVVYVLHGLAGLALVAFAIIHIYFALRPDKFALTRAMVTGTLDRDFVLEHHDPRQWPCADRK